MNRVKANWICETFQPVCACSGLTKSVHAYCRFAIMIIAMSDATSWNQRLFSRTTRLLDPEVSIRGRSLAQVGRPVTSGLSQERSQDRSLQTRRARFAVGGARFAVGDGLQHGRNGLKTVPYKRGVRA